MQKLTLFLGNGVTRKVICPYSDKNAIKEWLRKFYPVTCRFYREQEV